MPRGRPPKLERERRTSVIKFRVTPAERERIFDNANTAGMTPSAFARTVALGDPVRIRRGQSAEELVWQLGKISTNLSQLQGHADAGHLGVSDDVKHVGARVLTAIQFVSEEAPQRNFSPQLIADISHHGANVNQLARLANSGKYPSDDRILDALADLTGAVVRVFGR